MHEHEVDRDVYLVPRSRFAKCSGPAYTAVVALLVVARVMVHAMQHGSRFLRHEEVSLSRLCLLVTVSRTHSGSPYWFCWGVERSRGFVYPRSARLRFGVPTQSPFRRFSSRTTDTEISHRGLWVCGRSVALAGFSARLWVSAVEQQLQFRVGWPRGLPSVRARRGEDTQRSSTQLTQSLSDFPGRAPFRTSHDTRIRALRRIGHGLVIPLGFTIQGVQRVGLARAKYACGSCSPLSLPFWDRGTASRSSRAGTYRGTAVSWNRQTLAACRLDCTKRDCLRGGGHRALRRAMGRCRQCARHARRGYSFPRR